MSDTNTVVQLLAKSLQPSTAKESENGLRSLDAHQGFPLTLLNIVSSDKMDMGIRLAGALYFKNLVKRKWIDEDGHYHLHDEDVAAIKREIVNLLIHLPDHLQVQIGESISIIAESEFPQMWPELLDELVQKLGPNDMVTDKGILKIAHSIFKRWRPLFRSDELFLEIKFVLEKFAKPFLDLLLCVNQLIDQAESGPKENLSLLLENMLLLIKIYYDLNCQDIPEFFEDHLKDGMTVVHKYLKYHNTLLEDPSEDEEVDLTTQVKISICELIQLYTTRYEEEFHSFIPDFIQTVWDLLKNITMQPKYDILASRALQFLTAIAAAPTYAPTLNNEEALKQITEKIILPNITLRESDEEMFEDDPIEYIRRDLEGSDSDTRRRAATEFLRALKETNEKVVTEVILSYVNSYLSNFQADHSNWKSKDIAIYLFSAIAAKGSLTNAGVTVTNLLVDVIAFFTSYVAPDLVSSDAYPILKVDAIKYIFTFRKQLTKQQLSEAFPLLSAHFQDNNYVVYTYAAVTIEKILSLRDPTEHQKLLFDQNDISPSVVKELLTNLFGLMLKNGSTPEKLSENEFLMKCVMRVLLTTRTSLQDPNDVLQQLLKIVQIISKNPSNPKFSHYTFESICVILTDYSSSIEQYLTIIKPTLFGLLNQEVQEFVPYVFQILAYCLEVFPKGKPIPEEYHQIIKPLCSPAVWEYKGNIPAISRLISAIVSSSPSSFSNAEQLKPILGVFQKLISSKVNDNLGFHILETILTSINLQYTQNYLKEICVIIMTRLQSYKTEKFVKQFIIFLCWISCLPVSDSQVIDVNGLNSQFTIKFVDNVQNGLFGQIADHFIIPRINTFNNLVDKKILMVGLTNVVVENFESVGKERSLRTIAEVFKLLVSDSIKNYKNMDESLEILQNLDNDEMTFGSSYNELNIIRSNTVDPISNIKNRDMITQYVKAKLGAMNGFQNLISALSSIGDPELNEALEKLSYIH